MTTLLRSRALSAYRPLLADSRLDPAEARSLLAAARAAGPTPEIRADIADVVAAFGPALPAAERAALRAFAAGTTGPAAVSLSDVRTSAVVGPEDAARPGDLVKAPEIRWSTRDVVRGLEAFTQKLRDDPALKARLSSQPWPKDDPAAQLEWCLAYELADNKLEDPLWHTATNDSSAAATSYVHGVLAAHRAGLDLTKIEERVALAERAAQTRVTQDPSLASRIDSLPFPSTKSEQLEWAVLVMQYGWAPEHHPVYAANPEARAVADLVRGVLSKRANNSEQTLVVSERRRFSVDGDDRIYAVHTPKGPKPPGGWPTVVFFHGSYGGHAPEQQASYQALNDVADRHGFQVLYLVGAPQDRNDARTGRGMLNWDPVGAGPGGRNDRFVHELLASLITSGDVDKTRVIAAGHSQGGYYVSDLLAAYPDVFAGAAVFGAGPGSVMSQLGARGERKTPTYLFVGQDDIHLASGNQLAATLRSGGYGDALVYDSPPGRGHEVLPSDYERMFALLGEQVSPNTPLGSTDGKTITGADGGGAGGVVFRTHIDVSAPPPEVQADPRVWSLLAQLAQNPWLKLDGNDARFSVDEWKQALRYLHTWPPAMQQEIAALRRFFVVAPPPADAVDLSHTASPLWADRDIARAAYLLQAEPTFDLDGYPGLVSRAEVEAALAVRHLLQPDHVRGLEKLLPLFAPTTGGGVREVTTLPGGTRLEVYPGSGDAGARVAALVERLSAHPPFARTLREATILVSPPGRGLDAIDGFDSSLANAEGVAMPDGPDGVSGPPTLAIRHDSITRWDLGAAHELIHLLHFTLDEDAHREIERVRESLRAPGSRDDDYANPHEMFAFFGQWHLAGYGHLIRELSPQLSSLLEKHLGDARVLDPGWGEDGARAAITSLFQWFTTGERADR